MSAAAIQLLDHLRESGVEDEHAVKIAEAFDKRVEEAMREAKAHSDRNRSESEAQAERIRAEAKAHSDRNRAESEAQAERIRTEAEERAKSQFVTVDEYHKRDRTLATRDDLNTAIAALRTDNAALRADNAALRAEMSEIRAEVRAEISEIRAEFRAEMAGVRADNRATNRLILGGFVTLTAGIVAVVAKLYLGV